jgi:hypothetical protein
MQLPDYKKILHTLHRSSRDHSFSPDAHWKYILIVFIVINAIILGINGWLILRVFQGELYVGRSSNDFALEALDRTKLRSAVTHYEEKRAALERRTQEPLPIIDPSL